MNPATAWCSSRVQSRNGQDGLVVRVRVGLKRYAWGIGEWGAGAGRGCLRCGLSLAALGTRAGKCAAQRRRTLRASEGSGSAVARLKLGQPEHRPGKSLLSLAAAPGSTRGAPARSGWKRWAPLFLGLLPPYLDFGPHAAKPGPWGGWPGLPSSPCQLPRRRGTLEPCCGWKRSARRW